MNRSTVPTAGLVALLLLSCGAGCRDDAGEMQRIMSQKQAAQQNASRQDHLGETVSLLDEYIGLNEEKARQKIVYHVNDWLRENANRDAAAGKSDAEASPLPRIVESFSDMVPGDAIAGAIARPEFSTADVPLLRDANMFRHVAAWIDTPLRADPLLSSWFEQLRGAAQTETTRDAESELPVMTTSEIDRLQSAARLFDWTIRNIALEADQLPVPPGMQLPPMPPGIPFEGPGFRQSDYQTLWRGRGDWLQRCGVFTQLCLQAGIPTAVLATQSDETGLRTPWSVGVLIGEQIFLFEPRLGLPIPGPDQTGIATLTQARKDPTVMRRLNVAGFFDYPLSRTDIQQSVALLNVRIENLSSRMRMLESGLTGDRRMTLWVDADSWAERFDAVSGVAGVRIWEIPTLAEAYADAMEMFAERDPMFGFWYRSRFALLDANVSANNNLAQGRWRHLIGQFVDDDLDDELGARTHYLQQRAPEFEIDDLRINVDLQVQYGLRRELRVTPEQYDQQLREMQALLRLGKRTATYWLALVQYDDGRFETAFNWFTRRVLDDEQRSYWEDAAIYNAARSSEEMGNIDEAIRRLKTDRNISEHGNRLRARLLDKTLAEEEPESGEEVQEGDAT